MQVRGRGDRISFAESFKDVYNFRLLYASSVGFFPIKVRQGRRFFVSTVVSSTCISTSFFCHHPFERFSGGKLDETQSMMKRKTDKRVREKGSRRKKRDSH